MCYVPPYGLETQWRCRCQPCICAVFAVVIFNDQPAMVARYVACSTYGLGRRGARRCQPCICAVFPLGIIATRDHACVVARGYCSTGRTPSQYKLPLDFLLSYPTIGVV